MHELAIPFVRCRIALIVQSGSPSSQNIAFSGLILAFTEGGESSELASSVLITMNPSTWRSGLLGFGPAASWTSPPATQHIVATRTAISQQFSLVYSNHNSQGYSKMVGTRNHPRDFPPAPTESPAKRTTRSSASTPSSSVEMTPPSTQASSPLAAKVNQVPIKSQPTSASRTTPRTRNAQLWAHTPPASTLPWLAISVPIVIWDTIYIMGRPHTFAGGAIAWPFWQPYELYGRVDYVYSPEAYYSGLGWTAAQGLGNVFETLAYLVYLWIVVTHGRRDGKEEGVLGSLGALGERRRVEGKWGAVANLIGYTTFMVTLAKTVLYCRLSLKACLVKVSLLLTFACIGYNDAFMGFPTYFNNNWFNFIFIFAIPK